MARHLPATEPGTVSTLNSFTFRPIASLEPHRQAATQWLKEKTGLDVETKSLLITNGCAEAITGDSSSLAGPNDLCAVRKAPIMALSVCRGVGI